MILVILVILVIMVILVILVILVIMVILKLKKCVFSLPQTTMSKHGWVQIWKFDGHININVPSTLKRISDEVFPKMPWVTLKPSTLGWGEKDQTAIASNRQRCSNTMAWWDGALVSAFFIANPAIFLSYPKVIQRNSLSRPSMGNPHFPWSQGEICWFFKIDTQRQVFKMLLYQLYNF